MINLNKINCLNFLIKYRKLLNKQKIINKLSKKRQNKKNKKKIYIKIYQIYDYEN